MPRWCKLIDLDERSTRQHAALEAFLREHEIVFTRYISPAPTIDARFPECGYRRYQVFANNLCCAQAVLPAIAALATPDDDPPYQECA